MIRRIIQSITIMAVLVIAGVAAPAGHNISQAQNDERCFDATDHCIAGRIGEYWEQNGGLPVFGLPITPQQQESIEGQTLELQWFERNRLERHPENQPPYDVLLGRLGVDVLEQQGRDWQTFPKEQPQEGCRYFEETQFNVCGDILEAWRANGLEFDGQPGKSEAESLALFGLPISPAQPEEIQGQEFTVQWFERARFELHPENQPPYHVLLGLLGNEIRASGAMTPTVEPTSPPAAAPGGKLVFQTRRNENWDIYVMNTDGSDPVQLTTDPADDLHPAWSPDGSRIAFTSDRDGNENIFVMNADGSELTRLTTSEGDDAHPAWSPDGTKIAFSSDRDDEDGTEIYTINPDGSEVTRITDAGGHSREPAWSPDGTRIAYTATSGGQDNEIFVITLGEAEGVNLTDTSGDDERPDWSPDGSRIVFVTNREGNENIFVMNADGSDQSRRTSEDEDDNHPAWSPDGRYIIFSSERDENLELYRMTAEGSEKTRITNHLASDDEADWVNVGTP